MNRKQDLDQILDQALSEIHESRMDPQAEREAAARVLERVREESPAAAASPLRSGSWLETSKLLIGSTAMPRAPALSCVSGPRITRMGATSPLAVLENTKIASASETNSSS